MLSVPSHPRGIRHVTVFNVFLHAGPAEESGNASYIFREKFENEKIINKMSLWGRGTMGVIDKMSLWGEGHIDFLQELFL